MTLTQSASIPSEVPGHVLQLHGTGFLSRGECTGCQGEDLWAMRGHADDITRVFLSYHNGKAGVLPVPERRELPPVIPGQPYLAALERDIIANLATYLETARPALLALATGLARARDLYRSEPGVLQPQQAALIPEEHEQDWWDPACYVALLVARLTAMSGRQRQKLRHVTRSREEMQRLLEEK